MNAEKAFDVVGTFGRYQKLVTAVVFLSNFFYSQQMVLMVIVGATPNTSIPNQQNLTTIVTEFDLYDKKWVTDLIQMLFMGGFMTGTILFGQASDLIGRKPILVGCSTFMIISATCSGLAFSWQTFTVSRFFCGLFCGGTSVSIYVLMTELLGRNMWTIIGVTYQCFFSLGIVYLAGLAYALKNWRTLCLVSGGVGVVSLPMFIFMLPESPRWLYAMEKTDKAEEVFKLIARRNQNQIAELNLIPIKQRNQKKYTILHMFLYKKLAIWLLVTCFIWFTTSLAYYGLTMSAGNLTSDLYLGVALSGAVEIPAILGCIFLMDLKWLGRKGTVLGILMVSAATNAASALLPADTESTAHLVLGLASKLCIAGLFSVIYVYVTEIFPTPMRTVALGANSTTARLGAIVAAALPLLYKTIPYLPYVLFATTSLIAGLATLLLPKTLGKPLAETVEEIVNPTYQTIANYDDDDSNENVPQDPDEVTA